MNTHAYIQVAVHACTRINTLTSFKPMLAPYATFSSVFMVEYAVLIDIVNPVSAVGTSYCTSSSI